MIAIRDADLPVQTVDQVVHDEFPGRMLTSEEAGDVVAGDVSELRASFEGQHASLRSDRSQQGAGQGA